jgi:hypothetical protein
MLRISNMGMEASLDGDIVWGGDTEPGDNQVSHWRHGETLGQVGWEGKPARVMGRA